MESVSFLPENVKNCFIELLNEALKKCGNNYYNDAVFSVINYLGNNPNNKMFDYVLKKYPGVTKDLINKLALVKALELNYYRLKKDIYIDDKRLLILKNACEGFLDAVANRYSRLTLSKSDGFIVINDAFLYLCNLSDTYMNNSIKCSREDGFDEILSIFYGFTKFDHLEKLADEMSDKERLLGNLIEEVTHSIERVQFKNNTSPLFNSKYIINNKEVLDENDEIYDEIINNYTEKNVFNYKDIILTMEMVTSILCHKKDLDFELTDNEKRLLEEINLIINDKDKLINLYNTKEDLILKIFINNIYNIDKNDISNYKFDFNNKKID